MKKFWQFMGVGYLFMVRRKRVIVGLIIAVLIVGQLFMSAWILWQQQGIRKDMKKNQDNLTKLINKTYSQTWQINTKLNAKSVEADKKK